MQATASFPLDEERARALEAALERALARDTHPDEMRAAAHYVMGWIDEDGRPSRAGGKRTRPALCIVTCEALGGTLEHALPGAVAVELVHNFSLVHDEIQDEDLERHGRPTIWTRIGIGQAINVGDFLYTSALNALAGAPQPAGAKVRAIAALVDAVNRMVGGQWDDLSFEGGDAVTRDDYLQMVAGKTGSLLAAPVEIGAILAGASLPIVTAMGDWGRQAGLAFQIQDDYLGIWGDPSTTGKSNTNDISRRKTSFPIIAAMSDPEARSIISEEYAKTAPGGPDVTRVMSALERCGAKDTTQSVARAMAAQAKLILENAGLSAQSLDALAGVESALVDRRA